MNSLCPFFKENCKGDECIMWRNENCVIALFLERASEVSEQTKEEDISIEEPEENMRTGSIMHSEGDTPECLKDVTPEELAVEMIEFAKKEYPEEEGRRGFYTVSRFFWETKGVSRFFLSSEAQLKVDKANFMAEKEITKQEEAKKRQQLEKERGELPSLASQCVDWARMKGLKRLALTDIDAFLFDKEISILKETKRVLFSMANSELKSKG